jgi:hypothetical protein
MKRLVAVLLALTAAACATVPPAGPDAPTDIRRFLIAIRDGDRAAFEHYVDREALKTQLRGRVLAEAGRQGQGGAAVAALGAMFGGPLVDFATDAFVQPEVFRAMAERRGYRPDMGMPTADLISRYVRDIGGDAVCVVFKSDGPCQLIFRNQGGVFRLVGYEGELSSLMPGRPPAAPQS